MKTGIVKRTSAILLGTLLIFLLSVNALASVSVSWKTMEPMKESRAAFNTEVVNGKIYALGGISTSDGTTKYFVFSGGV